MKVMAYVKELDKVAEVELSAEVVREVFYAKDKDYLREDLFHHLEDAGYDPEKISDDVLSRMVEMFSDEHDCELADNDQWHNVIVEFKDELGGAK